MKIRLVTRDGGFVRDGEIPPMTPPPEVVTWGSRVFVHGLAHHPDAKQLTELPQVYTEGLMFPIEVTDRRAGSRLPPPDEPGFGS